MATLVLIIGESGTGKSKSIQSLDPKTSFLVQALNKPLPWKGGQKQFQLLTKENPNGNLVKTDDSETLLKTLSHIDDKMNHVKTVVVDDFQYFMVNEFMRRHSSAGKGNAVFQLYNEIADHTWNAIFLGGQLSRQDLIIFFLSHSQTDDSGNTRVKTIGKMLDDKVCLEGMFTIVLNTNVIDGKYTFQTQNSGRNTTKSPVGMFETMEIPNDLKIVSDKIREYYQ